MGKPDLVEAPLLQVNGDDVRVTGLRLRWPSRSTDDSLPKTTGVATSSRFHCTIIDHNDMSNWTNAAVEVEGDHPDEYGCGDDTGRDAVRIARSFIHHNDCWGPGYGVVVGAGSLASIASNTFLTNRAGKTDAFSVVSGNWMVSYGATLLWTYLRSRLTDSVTNLIVADFDGDRRATIRAGVPSTPKKAWTPITPSLPTTPTSTLVPSSISAISEASMFLLGK